MQRVIFGVLSAFLFTALSAGTAVAVCGDSVIDPGEGCDPPDGVCCSAVCQCNVCAVCGAGCFPPECNYTGGPPSSAGRAPRNRRHAS